MKRPNQEKSVGKGEKDGGWNLLYHRASLTLDLKLVSICTRIHSITPELVCVSSLRIDVESMKISAIRVNGYFQ